MWSMAVLATTGSAVANLFTSIALQWQVAPADALMIG